MWTFVAEDEARPFFSEEHRCLWSDASCTWQLRSSFSVFSLLDFWSFAKSLRAARDSLTNRFVSPARWWYAAFADRIDMWHLHTHSLYRTEVVLERAQALDGSNAQSVPVWRRSSLAENTGKDIEEKTYGCVTQRSSLPNASNVHSSWAAQETEIPTTKISGQR